MLVLTILGVIALVLIIIAIILLIGFLVRKFDDHCFDKFGYDFLRTSLVMLAATVLVLGGSYWCDEAIRNGGDVLNGLILMMIGGIIAVGLLTYTIWKTNLFYAVVITLLQIGIAALLAFFGMIVLMITAGLIVLYVLLSSEAQPVYIVNKD